MSINSSITLTCIIIVSPPRDTTPQREMLASTPIDASKMDKKKGNKVEDSNYSSYRVPPHSTLCEVVGYPTNMCPNLDDLKYLMHAQKTPANPPLSTGEKTTPTRNKAFFSNHECTICMEYKHYTHHCPVIPQYRDALSTLTQANTVAPSFLATPIMDDGSKTIFFVFEEEASCSYSPNTHGHTTSHHTGRQPKSVTPQPASLCAFCDEPDHLIN